MDHELHPPTRDGLGPLALTMLSPRDEDEVDTVWQLVNVSQYEHGQWTTTS